jgi:hypothetical protein
LEDCATTEKMIFIPTLKPPVQGGVRFSNFHAPPCADFRTFLSAINFGGTAGAFSKTTIFFKLQADVSLVSSAPPPRLHRTRPRPRPTPAAPELTKTTLLYLVVPADGGWGRSNKKYGVSTRLARSVESLHEEGPARQVGEPSGISSERLGARPW